MRSEGAIASVLDTLEDIDVRGDSHGVHFAPLKFTFDFSIP